MSLKLFSFAVNISLVTFFLFNFTEIPMPSISPGAKEVKSSATSIKEGEYFIRFLG